MLKPVNPGCFSISISTSLHFGATLATNHRNVALSANGKHVATSNKATYEHKIGPYVPGSYTLTAKGTVSGHQITNKGTYYLRANGQTYDLDLRTISFTVNGTPNTTVYINGENEGTINSSGTLALNDIPWSNRMMLTGKYKAGSQTLTAKQTNVSDAEGQDVDLKFAGVMSKDTASDYLNGIFTAVSSYTSTGDLSDASDYDDRTLDDYFGSTVPITRTTKNWSKWRRATTTMMTSSMSPMSRLSYQRFQQLNNKARSLMTSNMTLPTLKMNAFRSFVTPRRSRKPEGTTRLLKSRRPKKFGRTLNPMILMINEGEFNL